MSAPLGEELQTSECQIKQLSVLLIRLLAVQAGACDHLTITVTCQLGDEADVVVSDLHHLLAQVILGTNAALGASPPGELKDRFRRFKNMHQET